MNKVKYEFLERDPASSYKQLSIKGRRIRALTLYSAHVNEEDPSTIEQIADDYDLPVAAVREAIAYCESDPPEIRQDLQIDDALREATGMKDPNYRFHGKPKAISPADLGKLLDR